MFPSAEITSTAASLRDCTINLKGVIEPAKGHHVIFFRIEEFGKMSLQDAIYNFILSVAHELLHISGIKDEAKVHILEFEISEKFLGIYHSEDFKNRKLREAKRILQISKSQKDLFSTRIVRPSQKHFFTQVHFLGDTL